MQIARNSKYLGKYLFSSPLFFLRFIAALFHTRCFKDSIYSEIHAVLFKRKKKCNCALQVHRCTCKQDWVMRSLSDDAKFFRPTFSQIRPIQGYKLGLVTRLVLYTGCYRMYKLKGSVCTRKCESKTRSDHFCDVSRVTRFRRCNCFVICLILRTPILVGVPSNCIIFSIRNVYFSR